MKIKGKPSPVAPARRPREHRSRVNEFLSDYFWVIFKNVVGWVFILISPVLGIALPGPGGLPVFLIGFALVTFPGKRKFTSRVMRGRGLPLEANVFTFVTAFFAIVGTCIVMYLLVDRVYDVLDTIALDPRKKDNTYAAVLAGLVVTGLFALGVTWLVMRLSLKILNWVLKGIPFMRRRMRPWLRKKGIILLPSRRKQVLNGAEEQAAMNEEILEISERHQKRFRDIRSALLVWARRALGLAITIAIFVWIFNPIVHKWDQVRDQILKTSPSRFLLSAAMFAAFLFIFRVLVWRRIVKSFGTALPVAPATRIWSTSELARYIPGIIWQVWGRVYLCKPYGVTGSICSITQILELAIFLLANILVALACLLYFGIKQTSTEAQAAAQTALYAAAALLPLLLLLLHTKVFCGIINRVMRRMGKPAIVQRLRGRTLVMMLLWNIVGLLWQSLAIYLIVAIPLDLKLAWWWVVAGAYSLAWCAGFLAVWAPGGLGVRELVFVGAMTMILPDQLPTGQLRPLEELRPLLAFLSVLLRLWATAGEFMLAAVAYAVDYRGALGKPDAPGRVEPHFSPPAPSPEVRPRPGVNGAPGTPA
jgi:hypothetical protein